MSCATSAGSAAAARLGERSYHGISGPTSLAAGCPRLRHQREASSSDRHTYTRVARSSEEKRDALAKPRTTLSGARRPRAGGYRPSRPCNAQHDSRPLTSPLSAVGGRLLHRARRERRGRERRGLAGWYTAEDGSFWRSGPGPRLEETVVSLHDAIGLHIHEVAPRSSPGAGSSAPCLQGGVPI
eukprot:scaffold137_cov59-Phaeocystis_antarctica.AAC.2